MPITRRIATGAAVAAIATASMVGAGVIGAAGAGAAPATNHTSCKLKHGNDYPPGTCFTDFGNSTYKPHHSVSFKTGKDFTPGSKVHEHLSCHKYSHDIGTDKAGAAGRVKDSFKLPKSVKKGTCTLTLTGGSSTVTGDFKVS